MTKTDPGSDKPGDAPKSVPNKYVLWVVVVIGLVFVLLILYKTRFDLQAMANAEYARGAISYLLVLAFIVLGVLMIIAALFGPFQNDQASDAAFRRAREIYMSVVGIVGTIVGFYYGTGLTQTNPLELEVRQVSASLVVLVSGGTKPYRLNIKGDGKPYETKIDKGFAEVSICDQLSHPANGSYTIEIIDGKDQKAPRDVKIDYDKACAKNTPDKVDPKPKPKSESESINAPVKK